MAAKHDIAKRKEMEKKVLELIPEFEWIKDEDLRHSTLEVWCDAMEMGGWEPEELSEMPFTLLLDPCPASFLDHTRGVTNVAYHSGQTLNKFYPKSLKIRMDLLISGAILHDVGKLLEYTKKEGKVVKSERGKVLRHPYSGAALAFGKKLPDEVVHMIAMHAKEGNLAPRIPEAVIIHHADFTNFESLH